MRCLLTTIAVTILSVGSASAGELYTGYTVRGVSANPDQPAVGILIGNTLKLGVELIGDTRIVHGILETRGKVFAGLGGGYVTKHVQLDGHWQFTVTAGIHLGQVTVRWIHHSNGAYLLHNSNEDAIDRNMGVDLIALGINF